MLYMKWNEYGQIVGVNNAIRKYFGKEYYHEPDKTVLSWLNQNQFEHVIVLLIDAMGVSILQKHLDSSSFFLSHLKEELTTVFPPTTTAATTSLRTGKYPNETGWLGWNEYFKEKDDNIVLLMNKSQYTNRIYPDFSSNTLPVPFLDEEENCTSIWPFWNKLNPSKDYKDLLNNIYSKCKKYKYIYAYWDALDTCIHKTGTCSIEAKKILLEFDQETEQFAKKLPSNTGLVILADHSQIDVTFEYLDDYPDLVDTFKHLPAIEPRTIAFYIKEDQKNYFVQRFNELYGQSFKLYTHDEVIENCIFGANNNHPRFNEFVGDYLVVATDKVSLSYSKTHDHTKLTGGDHAGGLKEEAIIPLILYP